MSFRGGSHSTRRNNFHGNPPSLIKLVEEYLFQYKHLSFINLDHMGEVIRQKSFRHSRMKQSAFKEQLRNAYQMYSDNANKTLDEFSGANIEVDNTPLTDETLKEMEGYPSDSNSDGLEIDESPLQVTKDAGVSQMKNLYMTPAKTEKDTTKQDHKVSDTNKESKLEIDSASKQSSNCNNADKSDCISICSSTSTTDVPTLTKSETLTAKTTISTTTTTPENLNIYDDIRAQEGDESESDLEIIEEVHNERPQTSVITNGYAMSAIIAGTSTGVSIEPLLAPSQMVSSTGQANGITNASKSRVRTAVGSSAQQNTRNVDSLARGTKRKHNQTKDTDNSGGINEDLTRKRLKREVTVVRDTGYKLCDFAGSEKVVEEICKLLMHLKHPEVYQTLGVTPPRGFLLHGPPGTGKTLLANAIAGELQMPMLKVAGTELVSGISGESESNIRELFNQAVSVAPCIVFIDEIDSVTPRRENVNKEMERRIVAQLLACIDDLVNKEKGNQVLLIGATNRIEAIDTALRRAGRFDREICLGIPDEKSREKVLCIICRELKLEAGFEMRSLAKLTPGYVGADLQALVREAAVQAVNRKLLLKDTTEANLAETGMAMEVDHEHINCTIDLSKQDTNKAQDVKSVSLDTKVSDKPSYLDTEVPCVKSGTMDTASPGGKSAVVDPGSLDANSAAVDVEDSDAKSAILNIEASDTKSTVVEIEAKSAVVDIEAKSAVVDIEDSDGKSAVVDIEDSDDKSAVVDIEDSDAKSAILNIKASDTKSSVLNIKPKDSGDKSVDLLQLKISNVPVVEKKKHLPNPMRWIKETAPLSADELQDLFVTMIDFIFALKNVQPSSKREGFATVPDTTWDDIGALQDIRDELQVSILGPVKHAEAFKKLGLTTPAGVLLCGPPGCGKTLLAKAVANEAGINFISVKGPELLNMYVGESERAVRQCFQRARNSSPCVIFFDELDALCPRRSDVADSGSSGRIVNQLLTEMDGMESRQGVFVMAASNRPDIIDPAVLRPGRLDKILFVNLPNPKDRFEILKALTKNAAKPVLADDVNLENIANRPECEDYTGADLAALVREASIAAFREFVLHPQSENIDSNFDGDLKVYSRHFSIAFAKTKPSVGKDDRKKYKLMADRYSSIR